MSQAKQHVKGPESHTKSDPTPSALPTRRSIQLALAAGAAVAAWPQLPAQAFTLEDVTPKVVPAGPLSARSGQSAVCNCS